MTHDRDRQSPPAAPARTSLTPADIYARVRAHLLAQGRPAMDGSRCRYRAAADDGPPLVCAVGCLIPDGLYDPELEGLSAAALCDATEVVLDRRRRSVRRADALRAALPDVFNPANSPLLEALQDVHDNVFPDAWSECLPESYDDFVKAAWLDFGGGPR